MRSAREPAFRMHTINADSRFEGAGVLDVNRDGHLDIQCGSFWYEGPDWHKHDVRPIAAVGGYHLTFCDLPVDVDGDGWTDTINAAWHNQRLSWVRNPAMTGGEFEEIPIDEPGNIETAILADLNGDGQPDVIPDIFNGQPGWYQFRRDPAGKHGISWKKYDLPREMDGPGVGTGDVNGDGRLDIVSQKGWAEGPIDSTGPWAWHAEFDLEDPSIPILVHDVDGDGDADLIWGIGHGYGLYWLEQYRTATGDRAWARHVIDMSFSQAHVLLLGDIDGDGRQDFITGKRYYAHNGKDPGAEDPRVLYWYSFDPSRREWRRHVIQENGPAGVGTSAVLVDLDRDGDLDFVAPGKSGLYLFENLLSPSE
jgi:hypothetical protein